MEFELPSYIKAFWIIISSIYGHAKILNLRFSVRTYALALVFALFTTPMIAFVRINFPVYTIFLMTLCIACFFQFIYTRRISLNIGVSLLAVGLSYFFFTIGILVTSPLSYFLFRNQTEEKLIDIIIISLAGCLQPLFWYLLFCIKRLKKGIPGITRKLSGDVGVFIGVILIVISTLFFVEDDISGKLIHLLIILFILSLGAIIYLWWRNRITMGYIYNAQTRTIDILEKTVSEQKDEIQALSKIIHKDNKLLNALVLSVQTLMETKPDEKTAMYQKELELLAEDRALKLQAYQSQGFLIPETGEVLTDTVIKYLSKRAEENGIHFQCSITGSVKYLIQSIINEQDFITLLADLGENAIIATKNAQQKNLLLSIGVKGMNYTLDFFDSGQPFHSTVIENMGKKRYTTHKSEGGSGIGLLTTFELLKKYDASFEMEDILKNSLFTKRVSIVFDHLGAIRIFSTSEELFSVAEKRKDIDFKRTDS